MSGGNGLRVDSERRIKAPLILRNGQRSPCAFAHEKSADGSGASLFLPMIPGTGRNPRRYSDNRRACSALQGLGGWDTNKQSAKSLTIALLASIDCNYCFAGMRIFSTDSSFPLIVKMARVIS